MTGSQYNDVIQWTLADIPLDQVESSTQAVKKILQNCGIALPAGSEETMLLALLSDDYMGWRSCPFGDVQELANEGCPVIGINADHLILIAPEDSVLKVRGAYATPSGTNTVAKQASAVGLSERMDMQFFAYSAATTTTVSRWDMRIYLSPALHEYDNSCSYSSSCSENTHCNQYMDSLESYLRGFRFSVKRGSRTGTGSAEINRRTAEANNWPADLYYVCHTNAAGGNARGTWMFIDPNDAKAERWANKVFQWRDDIYDQTLRIKKQLLQEIKLTNMTCLYDEIVFHDNMDDITFFHNNMDRMALYTARAFRDIYDENIC